MEPADIDGGNVCDAGRPTCITYIMCSCPTVERSQATFPRGPIGDAETVLSYTYFGFCGEEMTRRAAQE